MSKMTNISDIELKVKISGGPGSRPMITTLEAGETAQFPDGYCEPVRGPGPDPLPCILSRSNTHLGVPALVPVEQAEEARARYLRVKNGQANTGPQAEIRRLEAELAAERVANKAAAPAPVEAPVEAPQAADDDQESLEDATTPKPKRKRKA